MCNSCKYCILSQFLSEIKVALESGIKGVLSLRVTAATEDLQIADVIAATLGQGNNVVNRQLGVLCRFAATLTLIVVALQQISSPLRWNLDTRRFLGFHLCLHSLVYVDELGMNKRDDYGYGWSEAGERFYGLKTGRRTDRINMIEGYRGDELIAPFTVEEACKRTVFEILVRDLFSACAKARRVGDYGQCQLSSRGLDYPVD